MKAGINGSVRLGFLTVILLTSAHGAILNGDFETGTLNGWTFGGEGSANALAGFGAVSTLSGGFSALLDNGPGDINGDDVPDTATLTSDSFVVPAGGGTLSFSIRFLTAEFTGLLADPARLDGFTVLLLAGNTVILSGDVTQPFVLLDGGNPVSAPHGSSFFEGRSLNYSAFIGAGSYQLRFIIADDGDGAFDSGLWIDDVAFTSSTNAIPEPATGILGGLGLMAVAIFRFGRKS